MLFSEEKKSIHCSQVIVVSVLVASGTQCNMKRNVICGVIGGKFPNWGGDGGCGEGWEVGANSLLSHFFQKEKKKKN